MKNIVFVLLLSILFACNNEGTDTTTKDSTTVIEKDNTVNRDTSINNMDTAARRDSVR